MHNYQIEVSQEANYRLRNIVEFTPDDPKGEAPGSKLVQLDKPTADQLNYAMAINNSPLRLVEV
jgi:hypothetical protein